MLYIGWSKRVFRWQGTPRKCRSSRYPGYSRSNRSTRPCWRKGSTRITGNARITSTVDSLCFGNFKVHVYLKKCLMFPVLTQHKYNLRVRVWVYLNCEIRVCVNGPWPLNCFTLTSYSSCLAYIVHKGLTSALQPTKYLPSQFDLNECILHIDVFICSLL